MKKSYPLYGAIIFLLVGIIITQFDYFELNILAYALRFPLGLIIERLVYNLEFLRHLGPSLYIELLVSGAFWGAVFNWSITTPSSDKS